MPAQIEIEIQRKCSQVEFLAGMLARKRDPQVADIALDALAAALRLEHQRRRTCSTS
ncbi:MAG TPA: hypothetical protein VM182_16975 [Terriglobia bacterium]|nr:hypothetical protein [Terriglobia bacterium]